MGLIQKLKEAHEKRAEEIKQSRDEYKKYIKKERKVAHSLRDVNFFPGNLDEYEKLVGYSCEIIPLNGRERYITGYINDTLLRYYGLKFQERMLEEGIEALIHYSEVPGSLASYNKYLGVPIRKKKNF